MRFYLDKSGGSAIVERGDIKLAFTWRQYRGAKNRNDGPIFGVINRYFNMLPEETQDALFDQMRGIYDIFHSTVPHVNQTLSEHIAPLAEKVSGFYNVLDFEHMKRWCVFEGNFHYPDDLKTEYGRFDPVTTYLVQDYQGLLFLSTLLKPMTLVWSEFITRIKHTTGNDRKELVALPLIYKTEIQGLPEYKKLQGYVDAITNSASGTVNCVFGGLGTADLSEWAMASAVIRRLAAGEVSTPGIALIKIIHGHLDQNVNNPKSLEGRGGKKRICERRPPSENRGSKEEDRTSIAETSRLRQSQPDHIPAINEVYVKNMVNMVKLADQSYPIKDSRWKQFTSAEAYEHVASLDIEIFHVQLVGIVLNDQVSARNILRMDHAANANVILATQALLKFWGFDGLAHLITARADELEEDTVRDVTGQAMTSEVAEELSAVYPHWQARGRPEAKGRKPLRHNYGMVFIENFTDVINNYRWHYSTPAYIFDGKNLNGTFMSIPSNLRIELAQLLIKTQR